MKLAIKAGLHPPIGASPGELRLWLKLNGLMDNGMKHADRKNHRIAQVGRRPAAGAARLPPLQKRAPLADCNVPRPLPSTYGRKKLEQALQQREQEDERLARARARVDQHVGARHRERQRLALDRRGRGDRLARERRRKVGPDEAGERARGATEGAAHATECN